jgi:hypothetical protein
MHSLRGVFAVVEYRADTICMEVGTAGVWSGVGGYSCLGSLDSQWHAVVWSFVSMVASTSKPSASNAL